MAEKSTGAGGVVAFCDGGSRGNPGPAAYGVFIQGASGEALAELSEFLGVATNNVAEYRGLLAALGWAVEHGASELRVVSDSELMVKQIKGQYSVKSPDLKPLYEEAKRRAAKLDRFEMQHVLRGKNQNADRLANEAMDRGTGKRAASQPEKPTSLPISSRKLVAAAGAVVAAAQPQVPLTPSRNALLKEVTGFVKNGVVHLVEGELPEGTFVRILPGKQ